MNILLTMLYDLNILRRVRYICMEHSSVRCGHGERSCDKMVKKVIKTCLAGVGIRIVN